MTEIEYFLKETFMYIFLDSQTTHLDKLCLACDVPEMCVKSQTFKSDSDLIWPQSAPEQ